MICKLFVFLVVAVLVFTSCAKKHEANLALVNANDAAMNRAIAEAQRTLPSFVERFTTPMTGDSSFVVKVMVSEKNGTEHLWVRDITVKDSLYTGIVDNEPQFVTSVKVNGPISFSSSMISDWAYTDSNGVRQGSFTLKVLLAGMNSSDADSYRSMFGWSDTVGVGLRNEPAK